MKNKKAPPERTRGALPRKIACGNVCGDPEGALHQMLCEFKMALDKAIRQIARGYSPPPK